MTWWEKKAVRRILKRIGAKDKRVVDAGCGPGILWRRFIKDARPRELFGLDISLTSMKAFGAAGGQGVAGDIQAPPFKPASFDVVMCLDIVEHVVGNRAKSKILLEMGRLVRPGGVLMVSVPHIMPMPRAFRFLRRKSGPIREEFANRLRSRGHRFDALFAPLLTRVFCVTDDLQRLGLVKARTAFFDDVGKEIEMRWRIPIHDELEHDQWISLFEEAGFRTRAVEPAGLLVPDIEAVEGSRWTMYIWQIAHAVFSTLSRDARYSFQLIALLEPTPALREVEDAVVPFPREPTLQSRTDFELLSGFPTEDHAWVSAYDAAVAAGAQIEVVAAPSEFKALLRWAVEPSALEIGGTALLDKKSRARVTMAIIHKGRLPDYPGPVLDEIRRSFRLVYANEVFAILSADPTAPTFTPAESDHARSFEILAQRSMDAATGTQKAVAPVAQV
ncbi:MAG: class I SAM-dependent methyltransferase [Euryarchaeota archaeon]|nr:class I SAM-dependent methyltransferase [Euryarchaeota archaeon]